MRLRSKPLRGLIIFCRGGSCGRDHSASDGKLGNGTGNN